MHSICVKSTGKTNTESGPRRIVFSTIRLYPRVIFLKRAIEYMLILLVECVSLAGQLLQALQAAHKCLMHPRGKQSALIPMLFSH